MREFERNCVVGGGDDYELAFTAPQTARGEIEALGAELGLTLTRVGLMRTGEAALALLDANGKPMAGARGFDHFA